MRKMASISIVFIILFYSSLSLAEFEYFKVKTVSDAEFYKFVSVFSEMRGPIRKEILKSKKTNFEEADPLEYVSKVKDEKSVKKALKDSELDWKQFNELMGNVLLGYFSIQPDKTKVSLLRQLSNYGLKLSNDQIPPEYQQMVMEALKTEEGAALASMALEHVLQIPPENTELARKNQRQLDQLFYTRFWKDQI